MTSTETIEVKTVAGKCSNIKCSNLPSQGQFALVRIGDVELWLCMPCAEIIRMIGK